MGKIKVAMDAQYKNIVAERKKICSLPTSNTGSMAGTINLTKNKEIDKLSVLRSEIESGQDQVVEAPESWERTQKSDELLRLSIDLLNKKEDSKESDSVAIYIDPGRHLVEKSRSVLNRISKPQLEKVKMTP